MVYSESAVTQCMDLMYEEGSMVRGLIATSAIGHIMFREPPWRSIVEIKDVKHLCSKAEGLFVLVIVMKRYHMLP